MRQGWMAILFGAALLLGNGQPAKAGSEIQVTDTQVTYLYGQEITFMAQVHASSPIKTVRVFYQAQGYPHTEIGQALLGNNGEVFFSQDLSNKPLPAFTTLLYWFEVTTQSGEVYTSPSFSIYYTDNRFAWQTLEQGSFRVHWVEGDTAFGQEILDFGQQGLKRFQEYLPVGLQGVVDIYIYANPTDLQSTLASIDPGWVAGHSLPARGLILVSIKPGPQGDLEAQRQVPHELAHVMLYKALGEQGYTQLPTWLNEGLASVSELFPNPDYQQMLQSAYRSQALLPMAALCDDLPREANTRLLAYAQAASFTQFLYQQYGSAGIQALVSTYQQGAGCLNSPLLAFGRSLTQLEQDWRAYTFGERSLIKSLGYMLPWVVLIGLLIAAPLGAMMFLRKRRANE